MVQSFQSADTRMVDARFSASSCSTTSDMAACPPLIAVWTLLRLADAPLKCHDGDSAPPAPLWHPRTLLLSLPCSGWLQVLAYLAASSSPAGSVAYDIGSLWPGDMSPSCRPDELSRGARQFIQDLCAPLTRPEYTPVLSD